MRRPVPTTVATSPWAKGDHLSQKETLGVCLNQSDSPPQKYGVRTWTCWVLRCGHAEHKGYRGMAMYGPHAKRWKKTWLATNEREKEWQEEERDPCVKLDTKADVTWDKVLVSLRIVQPQFPPLPASLPPPPLGFHEAALVFSLVPFSFCLSDSLPLKTIRQKEIDI